MQLNYRCSNIVAVVVRHLVSPEHQPTAPLSCLSHVLKYSDMASYPRGRLAYELARLAYLYPSLYWCLRVRRHLQGLCQYRRRRRITAKGEGKLPDKLSAYPFHTPKIYKSLISSPTNSGNSFLASFTILGLTS